MQDAEDVEGTPITSDKNAVRHAALAGAEGSAAMHGRDKRLKR